MGFTAEEERLLKDIIDRLRPVLDALKKYDDHGGNPRVVGFPPHSFEEYRGITSDVCAWCGTFRDNPIHGPC